MMRKICTSESKVLKLTNVLYDKIYVEAFEKDISLKGDNYTIFVDRNEDDETIVADVFMECVD